MLIYDNAPQLFLNSNMRRRQRFSGSLTTLTGTSLYYLDRMKSKTIGSFTSPQTGQSSLPANFPGSKTVSFANRMVGTPSDSAAGFETFQIIESIRYANMLESKVSLGFYGWVSNFQTARLIVQEPTVIDNYAAVNTLITEDIDVVDSDWHFYQIPNLDIPNANGLAFLIQFLNPANPGSGADTYITQMMGNPGSKIANWKMMGQHQDLEDIYLKRYYEKSYSMDVAPGTTGFPQGSQSYQTVSSGFFRPYVGFQVEKRLNPVAQIRNPSSGAVGQVVRDNGVSTVTLTNIVAGAHGFHAQSPSHSQNVEYRFHWTADSDF